jgi:hypothetical protein
MGLNSSIAWIDFSEKDRRQMTEVISLFRHRDTRDELGLGSVRDAFANLFFPGTSTLQTRARYFLFVPWIYRYLEGHHVPSRKIPYRLKRFEIRLIETLKGTDQDGVIGSVAGASLQRFPSSIYWNGLGQWKIRRFPGSQSQYHRWLDQFYQQQKRYTRPEDRESLSQDIETNWDPNLPDAPDDFPNGVDMHLPPNEARYLRERLLISCSNSLLATIVDQCQPVEDIDFIWKHPELAHFPSEQRAWIKHAHNFSETMYGAVLLYNLMLAELREDNKRMAEYEQDIQDWWETLGAQTSDFASWDRKAFWRLADNAGRISIRTRRFVNRWQDILFAARDVPKLSQYEPARQAVREREIWLKRGRSRFKSRRHLEMWSGQTGLGRLDYRWPIARDITNDILRGLTPEQEA